MEDSCTDSVLPILSGDEQRLKQVLIGLVSYAVDNTESGEVEIKASYHTCGHLLVVHVRDTGNGIESDNIPHLFEENSTRLGLFMAKHIVSKGRGEIDV